MKGFLKRFVGSLKSGAANSSSDDMSWFCPPGDLHDAAAWDRYWMNQIAHGLRPEIFDMFCDIQTMVAALQANGLHRVLYVGCGISLEPLALSVAGFDVTALDLSPAALEISARAYPDAPRRPTCVAGDLTDASICPGPFDAIVERRTLQLFPETERPAAMAAVANRMGPRGIFFSHSHDGRWKPPAPRRHFTRSWFEDHQWPIWDQTTPVTGRVAWLFLSTG